MRKSPMIVVGLTLVMTALPVSAKDAPIAPPSEPANLDHLDHVKSTVTVLLAQTATLGGYKIKLETTKLLDVQRDIGVGSVQQQGDASTALTWLCYDLPKQHQRLWLTSNEMGGGDNIDGVVAQITPAGVETSALCPVLPAKYRSLSVDRDLWLGMTKAELIKRLGAPSRQIDNWLTFYREVPQKKDFVEGATLTVKVVDDRIVYLSAYKITAD